LPDVAATLSDQEKSGKKDFRLIAIRRLRQFPSGPAFVEIEFKSFKNNNFTAEKLILD